MAQLIPVAFAALAAAIYTMAVGTEGLTVGMAVTGTFVLFVAYLMAFSAAWGLWRLLRTMRATPG